jgi:hypothetical protein
LNLKSLQHEIAPSSASRATSGDEGAPAKTTTATNVDQPANKHVSSTGDEGNTTATTATKSVDTIAVGELFCGGSSDQRNK